MHQILGIDIGATAIKGAVVDLEQGVLASEKIKYRTPSESTPQNVLKVMRTLVSDFEWGGKPVGIGFPSIVIKGICRTASNISSEWIDLDLCTFFSRGLQCPAYVANDADCAGLAEIAYGHKVLKSGTVLLITLGTGIGSAIFKDGALLPNTELGQLYYKESIAEHYASNSARKKKNMSWAEFGIELNAYLGHVNLLLSPDVIVLGGGISKFLDFYKPHLDDHLNIVAASMFNSAGVVGAALAYKIEEDKQKKQL